MVDAFRKLHPLEFYRKFLVHSVRPDGRNLAKVRKTTVTTGSIKTACGSSFVKIGNTSVSAGVKAECGVAPPDDPGSLPSSSSSSFSSCILVNVELTPLCSPNFKPGKPSEQAQYIATVLNRLVATAGLVDEAVLKIQEKEDQQTKKHRAMTWYLYVDIYCLDYDGNVFDACLIALLAALADVRLPLAQVVIRDEVQTVETTGDANHPIGLRHFPIPLSFAIFDEIYVLSDPTAEEEGLAGSIFTIIYDEKKDICFVIKPGGTTLSDGTLKECLERAKGRVDEVVPLLAGNSRK
jgi:exosome complex component RRP43